jgi:hypothetical protein
LRSADYYAAAGEGVREKEEILTAKSKKSNKGKKEEGEAREKKLLRLFRLRGTQKVIGYREN